jgi:hypothetical protein
MMITIASCYNTIAANFDELWQSFFYYQKKDLYMLTEPTAN